jgi:anti-anti-sigma regulatory factor
MSEPLTWSVDDTTSRTVVTVTGGLGLGDAARLRTALLKCLAEQPEALLVDLSALVPTAPSALAVFTALVRQASTWPAVPVLLCAASPSVAVLLEGGGYGRLPLHESVAAAHASLDQGLTVPRMLADDLLPVSGAPRHARDMATEACLLWSLPGLAGPASLIASELVTNVVDHVGTMMTLQLSQRGRYLHIAVRDGSPVAPDAKPGPSGLSLVGSVATHWGWLPARDGKVVWATLAVG